MSRQAKGPRLFLRKRVRRESVYVVRDGSYESNTGCGPGQEQGAEAALASYIGLYSGSWHSSITAAKWLPSLDSPWIDVERGILHRRGRAEAKTSKKRPPARIPPRLLAHLRRWHVADMTRGDVYVLSNGGKALAGQLRKGWAGARRDAGLDEHVTPHWLRHTAAAWLAQGGLEARQAADYLGMSEAAFEKVYYSASPDYQSDIGPGFEASKVKAWAVKNLPR